MAQALDLPNFRDFGAWPAGDGQCIAPGRLFRCGHPGVVSDDARQALVAMGFSLIVDLRRPDERQRHPWGWQAQPAPQIIEMDTDGAQADGDAPHLSLLNGQLGSVEAVDQAYRTLYQRMPFDPVYTTLFGRVLRAMAEPAVAPKASDRVLIHCTAGKDRTGVLAALILALLGVARQHILTDYRRSGDCPTLQARLPRLTRLIERRSGQSPDPAVARRILTVDAAWLAASFDSIEQQHGSVEHYARACGLSGPSLAALRQRWCATSE